MAMQTAFSSAISSAARKAPGRLPMPPTTTTTKASPIATRSRPRLRRLARQLQRAAEPGEERAEREDGGEQQRLVDAERADHLAVLRRRADQHAEAGARQHPPQQPQHQRPDDDQHQVVLREGAVPRISTEPRNPGARGPSRSSLPQSASVASWMISTRPKVASSWNSSGAR